MNQNQPDLEDWDLLPDDEFIEITRDDASIYSPPKFVDNPSTASAISIENYDPDVIKVESPRSSGFVPQMEGGFHLDIIGDTVQVVETGEESEGNGVFNLWKWGSSGIGAICSFGMAAAAVCIVIFSAGLGKNNKQGKNQAAVHHGTKLHSGGVPGITCGGHYD